MREYGKVAILFWQRGSGKRLRGDPAAQVVALYLVSCVYSNSVGLFYMGLPALAHDVGMPLEGASEALRRVCAAGFAKYDTASELVWVPNLAEIEIGNSLKSGDKRKKFVAETAAGFRNHPFAQEFYSLYGSRFGIEAPDFSGSPFEGVVELLWDPSEANSKAIQKQSKAKQKQIPDDVQTQELALTAPPSAPAVATKRRTAEQATRSVAVNRRYMQRYEEREGHPPTGVDQAFNGMLAKFSDKHANNALAIVDWFFDSPDPLFKRSGWKPQVLIDQAPRLWRELNNKQAAIESLAAPAQTRTLSLAANNELAYQEYLRRKEQKNATE